MRILIVDDDELSRELLTLLLEEEGYGVEAAESGEAALGVLGAKASIGVDAVLSDMKMPGLTGAALARRMRVGCGRAVRLLAMSGSQPAEAAIEGFDGFLLKPFSMAELAQALGVGEAEAGVVDLQAGRKPGKETTETLPAEVGGGQVLDWKTFAELSELMRPAQIAELYGMCLRDAETHVEAMREMEAFGDGEGFKRHAHAMKGSFGMLGARELQGMAAEMEVWGPSTTNDSATLPEFASAMCSLRRILMAHGLPIESSVGGERGT